MTFAVDQTSSIGQSNANSVTATFSTLPSATAFIIASVWLNSSTVPTLSDSKGNRYFVANSKASSGMGCYTFYTPYKLTLSGAASLTLTANILTTTFWGMQARSYTSTVQGTIFPDESAMKVAGGSGSEFGYSSGTPAFANSLFIGAFGNNSGSNPEGVFLDFTPPTASSTGFAIVNTAVNNGTSFEVGAMADLIATDQAAKTTFWTWTANDGPQFVSVLTPFFVQPFPIDVTNVSSQAIKRASFR